VKLALGTAQFGLSYGISNQSGQVSREEVSQVLALARANGIDTLDTAVAYGDSEACLGAVGTQGFKIVTKLPDFPDQVSDLYTWVGDQMHASLHRLGVDSVYGLLLHHPRKLIGPRGKSLADALERLKAQRVVQKVGVSIYSPQELDALTQVFNIDIVQAPLNLMDQRLVTSGWLQRLHDRGVEVHTRSAFLQGLLLMQRETIPAKFSPWFQLFDLWHAWLKERGVTAAEACLAFVASQPLIDRVVVGVESCPQLQELLRAASKESPLQLPDLRCQDERLINPSNWNSL
jgi:aryl-alcohol dehydrogenase-like predicted oxidoreductase